MAFKTLPGNAAVTRFIKTAAWATTVKAVRRAINLPQGREEDAGIVGIHGQLIASGLFIPKQNLLPGLSSIRRAKDSSFGVRAVGVAQSGYQNNVRIARVHDHAANVVRIMQANVPPAFAAVRG